MDPALPGVPKIPLTNYGGWFLVALLFSCALQGLDRTLGTVKPEGDDGLALGLFCWTWLGSAVAHALFLGLPASAGYGLVGMGLVGEPATQRPAATRTGIMPRRASTSRVERERLRV